jgi:hypothetical protein
VSTYSGAGVSCEIRKSSAGLFLSCLVCFVTTLLAPGVRAQSNEISFVQLNSATPQTPQTTVRVTYSGLEAAGDLNVVVVGWNDSHARITSGISPTISSNWSDQFPSNVAINNQGKVVINDSDHALDAATILNSDGSVNTSHTRPYIWENLTSGAAGVLFMDPYVISLPNTSPVRNTCSTPVNGICTGGLDTKYEPFRSSFGYLPAVAAKLDMVKATPQPNLSNTGFCLADAVASGAEYLVYAPNGGTFTVNLSATTHNLSVLWIDPTSGAQTSAGTVIGGSSSQSFTPPWGSSRDAVLYLVDVAGHN